MKTPRQKRPINFHKGLNDRDIGPDFYFLLFIFERRHLTVVNDVSGWVRSQMEEGGAGGVSDIVKVMSVDPVSLV